MSRRKKDGLAGTGGLEREWGQSCTICIVNSSKAFGFMDFVSMVSTYSWVQHNLES